MWIRSSEIHDGRFSDKGSDIKYLKNIKNLKKYKKNLKKSEQPASLYFCVVNLAAVHFSADTSVSLPF